MEGRTALAHTMLSSFPIMLQKFKKEIGVAIVQGQTKLKMARIYYVSATAG